MGPAAQSVAWQPEITMNYGKLLARLFRVDVLVIDDWALSPTRDSDRHDLFEVIEDRYGNRSTIITSQLPPSKWHEYLGDPTVGDAILDRLLHNAHRSVVKGSVPPEGGPRR
jgi:DNA replication protein DnaC